MNAKDEEFGEERLMALLRHGTGSAEECRNQIVAAVTQFSDRALHDDATVLVMRVN